ncbi:hypothetical protein ACFFN3_18955, partial [Leifsonia shinshuensis]
MPAPSVRPELERNTTGSAESRAVVTASRSSAARPAPAPIVEAVPSVYSSMGIVGSVDDGALDLDAVLRRRRAAS